jgi:PKD repeat protein
VEPYNAYAPKGRKKHPIEIVEEQELMARIIAEAQKNATLPPTAPAPTTPTIGGTPQAGSSNLLPQFFAPSMNISFSVSPVTASAPALVNYVLSGDGTLVALNLLNYTWVDGDGLPNFGNSNLFTTTGSFTVQMTASAKINSATQVKQSATVVITAPWVTASFTASPTNSTGSSYTASIGSLITFTNTTTTQNPANVINYTWNFGSGSITSSVVNPTFTYTSASVYRVLLSATGSFNTASSATASIQIS